MWLINLVGNVLGVIALFFVLECCIEEGESEREPPESPASGFNGHILFSR